ncbi:MAG: lipase family protein [Cyanobacteria bacterium J06641_5]
MHYVTHIDRPKALLLANACTQAYNAFSRESPAICQADKVVSPVGYELIDHWSGIDAVFNRDKTVEYFGLVFRSVRPPHTYIFAFRGTSSALDLVKDCQFRDTDFIPYLDDITVPEEVKVENGFFTIYTDAVAGTVSMQEQLFTLLRKYQNSDKPIDRLHVTGHSLGASLSTLFTLDLALSRPEILASNYNFASPRVGNAEFVDFFDRQAPQQASETRLLRIQNVYDRVPCTPFEKMGYQHLPNAYLIAFHRAKAFNPEFIGEDHLIENYQAVLKCAFASQTGICINPRLEVPASGDTLTSVAPNPEDICAFLL